MATEVKEATRIEPNELKGLLAGGTVVILDMRRDYDESDKKIPGAIRVDPDAYKQYEGSLPRGKTILTYCT